MLFPEDEGRAYAAGSWPAALEAPGPTAELAASSSAPPPAALPPSFAACTAGRPWPHPHPPPRYLCCWPAAPTHLDEVPLRRDVLPDVQRPVLLLGCGGKPGPSAKGSGRCASRRVRGQAQHHTHRTCATRGAPWESDANSLVQLSAAAAGCASGPPKARSPTAAGAVYRAHRKEASIRNCIRVIRCCTACTCPLPIASPPAQLSTPGCKWPSHGPGTWAHVA